MPVFKSYDCVGGQGKYIFALNLNFGVHKHAGNQGFVILLEVTMDNRTPVSRQVSSNQDNGAFVSFLRIGIGIRDHLLSKPQTPNPKPLIINGKVLINLKYASMKNIVNS